MFFFSRTKLLPLVIKVYRYECYTYTNRRRDLIVPYVETHWLKKGRGRPLCFYECLRSHSLEFGMVKWTIGEKAILSTHILLPNEIASVKITLYFKCFNYLKSSLSPIDLDTHFSISWNLHCQIANCNIFSKNLE